MVTAGKLTCVDVLATQWKVVHQSLGESYLPQVKVTVAESSGRQMQLHSPYSHEALVEHLSDLFSMPLEFCGPSIERIAVVQPQVLDINYVKATFRHSISELSQRRHELRQNQLPRRSRRLKIGAERRRLLLSDSDPLTAAFDNQGVKNDRTRLCARSTQV